MRDPASLMNACLSTSTTYCALVSYPSPKSKYLTVVTGHECPDDVLFLWHMHVKDVQKLRNPAVNGLEAYLCLFLTLLDNLSRMLICILILIICLVSIPNIPGLEYIRSIPWPFSLHSFPVRKCTCIPKFIIEIMSVIVPVISMCKCHVSTYMPAITFPF